MLAGAKTARQGIILLLQEIRRDLGGRLVLRDGNFAIEDVDDDLRLGRRDEGLEDALDEWV